MPLRIAVGLATAGRSAILAQTLEELGRQTRPPDVVVVCPATPADRPLEASLANPTYRAMLVEGPRGLCAQRNAILEAVADMDLVVFFDDDFFPCPDYLERVEAIALHRPDGVVFTGDVLADGATGPGIKPHEARALIARSTSAGPEGAAVTPVHNGYGCNMSLRMAPIVAAALRFDEALSLYGWLEDVDFSRRLAAASGGAVLRVPACRGVHLGTKAGRMPGVRFGYSQIANPIHIWRKRAISTRWMLAQVSRNLLANFARLPAPEPWVDRRGRVRGNLMALRDLFAGRMRPQKILELK